MECLQPTITESEKSTLHPVSLLYVGHVVEGRFVPSHVYIQADTLEAQESVQAFVRVLGWSGPTME